MKTFFIIFTLLFSFSVLADCCNSFELEDCKTEILKSLGCDDHASGEADHEICHCSFTCAPKIFKQQSFNLTTEVTFSSITFLKYILSLETLDPLPIFHPPIS